MTELDELFKGFNLKYDSKELLEHIWATSTALNASLGALKDLVIHNLSIITNKSTDELDEQFKELNSLHTKEIIADLLSRFGEVNNSGDSQEKPED